MVVVSPELSGSTLLATATSLRRSNPLMPLRAASTALAAGLVYQTNVVRGGMYDLIQDRSTRRKISEHGGLGVQQFFFR